MASDSGNTSISNLHIDEIPVSIGEHDRLFCEDGHEPVECERSGKLCACPDCGREWDLDAVIEACSPYCFIVREGDTASMYCTECIRDYIGDGDVQGIYSKNHVGGEAVCAGCSANLANPEEVGLSE